MGGMPKVLTAQEAADYLKITKEVCITELEAGRIKGFMIAGQWRTTEDEVIRVITEAMNAVPPPAAITNDIPASYQTSKQSRADRFTWTDDDLIVTPPNQAGTHRKGALKLEQIKSMQWNKIESFN